MAQKLILFEDILNGAAIKSNKTLMAELGKLAEYVFGESGFSIEKAEKKADDIQIWSGDELYKALANDYGTAFRFKSAFVIEADGYVGPVMAWFFEPDGAFDDQIVVLTCESNGLFKNPRYVCGLLISEYDHERLLGEFGDDHDDEDEENEDWDEDEEDWEDDEDEDEDDEDDDEDDDEEDDDEEDEDEDDDDDNEFRVVDGECVFPKGVTEIPDEAFSEEYDIEAVEIPKSVEVIGDGAFFMCRHLKTVKISGPLKKICADAFSGCRRLVSINIPDTVTRIGTDAFSDCKNLTQLVIPDSVRNIGDDAFDGCDSLERIYIKNPDLLEDTGISENVEIITDFNEKDIQTVIQRSPREHIILYAIKVTVGQAIKDLKKIVDDSPNAIVNFSDPFHNGTDYYIKDVLEWNGLAVLTSSYDKDDAASSENLLDMLSDIDGDTELVLRCGWGWGLRNLEPEEDGTIFQRDDDYIYLHYEEHDIRLFSAEDLSHLFSDFAQKYPDRKVVCKTKDGSYYPVVGAYDDDGEGYIVVKKSDETISASEFKDALDNFYWSEAEVVVSFSPTQSYAAIFAKHAPVFFEDKVDGEDVIAFRLGETLCDTRIEDPSDDDGDFFSDDDTVVTKDDLCDEEDVAAEEEANTDDTIEEESAPEAVAKEEATDKGDMILKLVSYEGSIIKMMTVLSSIEGIDEEAAFNILQKLPAVVKGGISAKAAMKIGAILEDAGATVELARASDPGAETAPPKSEPEKQKPSPSPKPKPAEPKRPPMEYVDLGLSVKWAKWNLGATAPEESGYFFAWGETSPKSEYESDNYRFSEKGKGLVKYNSKDNYGSVVDNLKQLELCDDAAHVILGGDWRMPTAKEIKELNDNCSFSRATINGVKGSKVKSKKKGYTDRWIFFPDTGFKSGEEVLGCKEGFYWTSSLYTRRPDCGLMIFCNNWDDDRSDRYHGLAIRPVSK